SLKQKEKLVSDETKKKRAPSPGHTSEARAGYGPRGGRSGRLGGALARNDGRTLAGRALARLRGLRVDRAARNRGVRRTRDRADVLAGVDGDSDVLLHEARRMLARDLVELTAGDRQRGQRTLELLDALGGEFSAGTRAREGDVREREGAGAQVGGGFEHFFLEIHDSSCAATQQCCVASYFGALQCQEPIQAAWGVPESRKERTTGTTLSMEWSMNRWPPPGTMNSRLLGISREMIREFTGGTSGSS